MTNRQPCPTQTLTLTLTPPWGACLLPNHCYTYADTTQQAVHDQCGRRGVLGGGTVTGTVNETVNDTVVGSMWTTTTTTGEKKKRKKNWTHLLGDLRHRDALQHLPELRRRSLPRLTSNVSGTREGPGAVPPREGDDARRADRRVGADGDAADLRVRFGVQFGVQRALGSGLGLRLESGHTGGPLLGNVIIT